MDFSLLGSLQSLEHPHLITREIYQRPFYIFVSEKHPLAQQKEISFAELLDCPFIILDEGHIHLDAFNKLNARHHNAAQILLTFNDPLMIAQMVGQNLGITLMSDFAFLAHVKGLVKIPLVADEELAFHVSYAYSKDYVIKESLERFIALLDYLSEDMS